MKKVAILGSSGSIGMNSLNVIREFNRDFQITALSVNSNVNALLTQIREFNVGIAAITDKNAFAKIKDAANLTCEIFEGKDGLLKIAREADYDILINSLVGFAGLPPTVEAIKRGKRIALANKETLVAGGEFIIDLCDKYDAEIIPIDSEHSAIFQCIVGEAKEDISKIYLTASGGPFLNYKKDSLKEVTLDQALAHPNWKMGAKITIDSATMMNKGLEVIEAKWLFNIDIDKIEALIHPQSIIHSMVEFIDGSIKAQLSAPDMRLPIQYALSFPKRLQNRNNIETNFHKFNNLTFIEPDYDKFECLKLAYDALKAGGSAPCVLNAANEIAVNKFLKKEIKFIQIPEIIKIALNEIKPGKIADLESIIDFDRTTREFALNII